MNVCLKVRKHKWKNIFALLCNTNNNFRCSGNPGGIIVNPISRETTRMPHTLHLLLRLIYANILPYIKFGLINDFTKSSTSPSIILQPGTLLNMILFRKKRVKSMSFLFNRIFVTSLAILPPAPGMITFFILISLMKPYRSQSDNERRSSTFFRRLR